MSVNLKGKSFLTLMDLTPQEIRYLLDLGKDLKAKRRAGICGRALEGKHIVLLFEKTSTRTRCSFEDALSQSGGHVTYLDAASSQMGKKESLEDSAKVLGRFFDGIEYRTRYLRVWWRTWRNTAACRSSTASPTWTTPPRFWRT